MGREIGAILADIGSWVRSRPDVHGAALVGSYASGRARADSDVDLMIIADAPDSYRNVRWVEAALAQRTVVGTRAQRFGNVWSLFVTPSEGPEIEFTFAERTWAKADPPAPEVRRIIRDGVVILYDPRGKLLALCRACDVQPRTFS